MNAVQVTSWGILEEKETIILSPGDEQVLVDVDSTTINPFDSKLIFGFYKKNIPLKLPFTPGSDFSGVVRKAGSKVTGFSEGMEVFGSASLLSGGTGSFAQQTLASIEAIAPKPKNVTFEEAGASVLVGVSALQALEEHIKLKKEEKILIHGGAGGIGHIAVQMAVAMGAHVSTTVSTEDIDFVKNLGVTGVVDYTKEDFANVLKEYDSVFDTVGGETTGKSFDVLKRGGVLVTMLGDIDQKLAVEKGVIAIKQQTKVNNERLLRLAGYLDTGKVKVHIPETFPLSEATKAFNFFNSNKHRGKIVLKVRS